MKKGRVPPPGAAQRLQCDFFKVTNRIYLLNGFENRKTKATFIYKTFDFTFWGTFLAPNSEVFVQENFLKVGQK